MPITLYEAPMSSATPVVQTIHELELPCERVAFELSKGKQRETHFLALNPNGKVPTLVVDGTPMFEALAIMQWLGDRYGVERGLWPAADAPARMEAMAWSTWAYVSYGNTLSRFIVSGSELVPAELHHGPQRRKAGDELQALLAILDRRLAERAFVLGERYSLCDLIVAGVVTYSTFCGVPVEAHAHVSAWLGRCNARPSFDAAWSRG